MASNAAEDLAWAPHADSQPERIIHLPRYPSLDDCVEEGPEGPCAHHECRYHLAHRGYWEHELEPNGDCSLDLANDGPHTLDEVAMALGMSSERVRRIERHAMEALRLEPSLRQFYDDDELPGLGQGRARRGRR